MDPLFYKAPATLHTTKSWYNYHDLYHKLQVFEVIFRHAHAQPSSDKLTIIQMHKSTEDADCWTLCQVFDDIKAAMGTSNQAFYISIVPPRHRFQNHVRMVGRIH